MIRETSVPGRGLATLQISGVDQRRAYAASGQNVQYLTAIVPREDHVRRMYGKEVFGNLGSPIVTVYPGVEANTVYVQTRAGLFLLRIDLPIDPDAEQFFTRVGPLSDSQRIAVTNFVKALKGGKIWNKFYAIYLYIGGTAAKHSHNLISSNYQITWHGTVTHNANGITGNGTTGFGDTGLKPSDMIANGGLSVYMRGIPTGSNRKAIGVDDAVSIIYDIVTSPATPERYGRFGVNAAAYSATTVTAGFYSINRTGSTSLRFDYNGAQLATSPTPSSVVAINFNFYVLANNGAGIPTFFSNENDALTAIHAGFTQAESLIFYNAVQAYQTALGRQV
jgi:hypothetical protein